jgi:L-aminopeptidase/D-esterase-like protein
VTADLSRFGLVVGHATDEAGGTGLTVVRGAGDPFRASVATIGRAVGSREMDALAPSHLVGRVDAILLTGGSAYGLDAAAGVMRWMEERGRGFPVPGGVVPIVPAAVVFDLAPLGRFDARPTAAMAYAATEHATATGIAEGSVGAGTGATVGKAAGVDHAMKGGVGIAVAESPAGGDVAACAVAVVNAFGDIRDGHGAILAGARTAGGGWADALQLLAAGEPGAPRLGAPAPGNTTLAVVGVSAGITRTELAQLARACASALHRRITPVGTSYDGDVIFALCPIDARPAPLVQLETLAAAALESAIERAVRHARGRDGVPGLADGAPHR